MNFDRPPHGDAPIDVPAPANPRVDHVEALARAIGEKYPAIRTRLDLTSPGWPATLRTAYGETFENIECDFTDDGWYYRWSFGNNTIGPASDPRWGGLRHREPARAPHADVAIKLTTDKGPGLVQRLQQFPYRRVSALSLDVACHHHGTVVASKGTRCGLSCGHQRTRSRGTILAGSDD
jgi:hypothetical protein